ncbi:MAG: Fe-S cluster assembly protein SufD [Bacteroidales bacterium]
MKVANQYIDLYEQTKGMIDKHSAHVLNTRRESAVVMLKGAGLPATTDEAYAHTDVKAMFEPDYGLNLSRLDIPVNPYEVFRCDVPNLSTHLYFMVNDQFYTKEQPSAKLPDGVFAGSLKEFAVHYPQLADKYYDKQASDCSDGTVAINTMFAQDGFVLYVPKNIKVEKPIQLVNVLRGDVDFMANRRILIIIEHHAEAKLLICDHAMNDVNFLANQVAEIFVEEGAFFDYYELEENTTSTKRIASTFLNQQANSNVMTNSITLTNGITRNNFFVTFKGEGAETHLSGMAIEDGEQHVDNFSFIDHAVPHCHSNELFKYILNDQAQGSFAGRILVREGAQKTEAYQSNKNLCATDQARMFTRPELEIYADDVKCSHGATVGQLDNQAMFYLRSRGLTESEARTLLMFAFTADVIDQIRLEPLKERLRMLVEKRFRGELTKCRTCNNDCK